MTWDEVKDHARTLQISAAGSTWLRCGAEEHTICLRLKEPAGRPVVICLEVLVAVCAEKLLDHRAALRIGTALSAGALVLEGNTYVLRQLMPLASASRADLAGTLTYLGRVASVLRRRAAANGAGIGGCFTWCSE